MASMWGWISRRREENILRLELDHLSKIESTAQAVERLLDALSKADRSAVEEAFRAVKEAEREADAVKDTIIVTLSSGIIHPIDREELLRLVLTADDIAAYLLSASRRLLHLARLGEKVENDIMDGLRLIAGKTLESVTLLKEAIETVKKDPKKAIELAKRVERLEEEADEIRSSTEEKVVMWCNMIGKPGSCTLLYNALTALETSTDKCEDTADLIRSIAVLTV